MAASDDRLILEGILTTQDGGGDVNIAPMGPIVDRSMQSLRLRPFQPSRTYENLRDRGEAVFHVVDDVELLARAALGQLTERPALDWNCTQSGAVLAASCRWYALRVESIDDRQPRTEIQCAVVECGRLRDFLGWNRAQFAVIEAAILATRLHLTGKEQVRIRLGQLAEIVDKTAGAQERRGFTVVQDYVESYEEKVMDPYRAD